MCATSPIEASAQQRTDVNAILGELGVDAEAEPERLLEVWNKADLLDAAASARDRERGRARSHPPLPVSAVTGYGLRALLAEIEARLNRARDTLDLVLEPGGGRPSNWIYENCEVSDRNELGTASPICASASRPEKRTGFARHAGPAVSTSAAERSSGFSSLPPLPHPRADPSLRASRLPACGLGAEALASMLRNRRTNFALASRSAASGSTPRCRATFAMTKSRSPNSSATFFDAGAPASRFVGNRGFELGDLLLDLGEHRLERRPVEADARRARCSFTARVSAGRATGTSSSNDPLAVPPPRATFSSALMRSQVPLVRNLP